MKNNKIIYTFGPFLLFIFVWYFIGFTSGAITSGFHFVDDWRYFEFGDKFLEVGFFETILNVIKSDLTNRFRPFFGIFQVIECYILGVNYFNWMLVHTFFAVLTCQFTYIGLRILGFSVFEGLIFPLIWLFGKSSALWWRLGTAETYSLLLLSLSFLFYSIYLRDKKFFYFILTFVTFLISSLSKESFILLYPAFILAHFLYYRFKLAKRESYLESLNKNWGFILLYGVTFLTIIGIIYFVIGTEESGYAGLNSDHGYFKTFLSLYYKSNGDVSILLFLVMAIYMLVKKLEKAKELIVYVILLFMSINFSQVLLYAKSGIYERYLQPGLLSYTFLILIPYFFLKNNWKKNDLTFFEKRNLFLIFFAIFGAATFALQWNVVSEGFLNLYGTIKKNPPSYFLIQTKYFIFFFFVTFGVFFISGIKKVRDRFVIPFYAKEGLVRPYQRLLTFFILFLIVTTSFTTYRHAVGHTEASIFIKEQELLINQNTKEDDPVLYVIEPVAVEVFTSHKIFLEKIMGRKNILISLQPLLNYETGLNKKLKGIMESISYPFDIKRKENGPLMKKIKLIFVFKGYEDAFFKENHDKFNQDDFQKVELYELFNAYIKKNNSSPLKNREEN